MRCWQAAVCLLVGLAATSVAAGDRRVPGTDKVIVHLWEWSWEDIAIECETFLGPAGYAAVQVSPPQEDHIGNQWWTRYQPVSYKILSRSGNETAFRSMVARCKKVGVDIIVDAVINHMINDQATVGRAGSPVVTKCNLPGTYSCPDFHHYCAGGGCSCSSGSCGNCETDWGSCDADNFHNCNMLGLPDLATGTDWVRRQISGYLRSLSDMGVAGIRIDAAKSIPSSDLTAIMDMSNSNLYVNQEIAIGGYCDAKAIRVADYSPIGSIWEFKYPSVIRDAFNSLDLGRLNSIDSGSCYPDGTCGTWAPGNRAVSFVTNHDMFSDPSRSIWLDRGGAYWAANLIMLAHPYGQPTLLSSVNSYRGPDKSRPDFDNAPVNFNDCPQGSNNCTLARVHDANFNVVGCGALKSNSPYVCEHRWPAFAAMVAWRKAAGLSGFTDGGYQFLPGNNGDSNRRVAMTRGGGSRGQAFLFVNVDPQRYDGWLNTRGMPSGTYCNVAIDGCWPCTAKCGWTARVFPDGTTNIKVNQFEAVAFHTGSMLPAVAAADVQM